MLTPEVAPSDGSTKAVRLVGMGKGALLGMGTTEKRIESEVDPKNFAARRWTNVTATSTRTTKDAAEQAKPGSLALLRKRTGEPDLAETFTRTAVVLDPLSFLLRLRVALPQTPTTYEVLDGRALWIVKVSAVSPDPSGHLRLEGRFDPIYWNGTPDPLRTSRSFALFFARDRFHTPVKLVVPYGAGELEAELTHLDRPQAEPDEPSECRRVCGDLGSPRNWYRILSRSLAALATQRRHGAPRH